MLLYIIIFLISVIIFYGTLNETQRVQMNVASAFLVALGIFIGMSDMFGGYDRYTYAELFDNICVAIDLNENPFYSFGFQYFKNEYGYGTLNVLLAYITCNRYIFILLYTLIIYVLLIISLRRYAYNMPFSVIIFLGLWVFFSFTYLRQVMACSIAWLGIKYIIERDWKRFLLITFIAYSFHNSAIIFSVLYFIPIRKFPIRYVIFVMVIALLLGLSNIPSLAYEVYGNINESRMQDYYGLDKGFRVAYLLEACFFLYVIFLNYHRIDNDRRTLVFTNMTLMVCLILLLFVRSEEGGRFAWYYLMGPICLMPQLLLNGKKLTSQLPLVLCLMFYLYMRIVVAWGSFMFLYPYKTFLTDGHREGDPIYRDYEYDLNYDRDKFYRPVCRFWK